MHADLSEYNILWHEGQCWFIDVSQSVEPNHPNGLEFLYRDCKNISDFFKSRQVFECMEPEELFAHVTGLVFADGLSQEEIISQVSRHPDNQGCKVVYEFKLFVILGSKLPKRRRNIKRC